ncbi:protein Ycf2-like [Pyrus communis]|uniref:protein Ycf2-like n=1 Tax=Pyrus communis TaxID=23211 RepID=UPI0035C13E58
MEVKSSDKEWRRIPSSTPPKRPLTPKPSASDENDQYYQQVGNSNQQSPKKPLTKNYMSPTISAASKSNATASRKNILRERNDASQPDFSNIHVEKSQSPKKPTTKNNMSPTISISAASKSRALASRKNILGERKEASEPDFSNTHVEKSHIAIDNVNHSLSQALPKSPPSFQSHDADEALSDDLVSRPYDPVTNYLSPRPQFLRYKPNRRQELFLGLENGVGFSTSTSGSFDYQKATGEEVGAVTSPSSLASPRPDGSLKQEDEEVELSDSGSFDHQKATDEEVGAFTSPGSLALPHPDGSLKQEDEEIELNDSRSFDYQKATDEEVGAVTSPGSLALPHPDGTLKQEDEGIELSDEDIEAGDAEVEGSDEEEYEEVEEEKIGKLKGVLKSLLLLLAIVLFASYMSPMNHQTHFEGMEDAYCSIQNSTIEAALLKKLESRGNLWDQKEERHTGFVEVIKGAIEMGTEEVIVQGEEMQIDEDIEDEAKVEDENLGDVELADEMREVVKPQAEEIEEEKEGGIHGLGEVVVMPQPEDIEDISGDIVENSEFQGVGPSVSDDFDHQNLVSDVSNAFEKGEVAAEQNDGIVEKIMEGAEESSTNMAAEPVIPETMDNDDISFDEASDLKAEGNWREELINFMKSKTFYAAAIGVSVFSVTVASECY